MDTSITIGFPNEEKRTYTISKDVAHQYPNSIFSLYIASESTESIILNDITYESFGQVFDVMNNNKYQWTLDNNILIWMDKYGLSNDALFSFQQYLNEENNNKMLTLKEFIDGEIKCITPNSLQKYEKLKQLFSNYKNIIPVHVTLDSNEIICVHIYECIPIYYFNGIEMYLDRYNSTMKNLKLDNIIDVNMLKYNIVVKNIGCEHCITCIEHANIDGKPKDGCPECNICEHARYEEHRIIDKNMYSNNFNDYFTSIHNLIYEERGPCQHYLKIPGTVQMMDLTNIATPEFIKDMPTYFQKINDIIPKTYKQFKTPYFSLQQKNHEGEIHHSNIKTYSLFVNIH